MLKAAGFLMIAILETVIGQGEHISAIEVHDKGTIRVPEERARTQIRILATRLLESSNFNSQRHRDLLKATPKETHAAYRKTVAGRYLIVSFDRPRSIKTIGGEVEALEVVIGLNRPDYADSLFTIDGEGRVVAHAKYSGSDAVTLLRKVNAAEPVP